jgi:hypothetical protein
MSVLPSKPNNLSATVERDFQINKLGFTLKWTDPTFNGYSDILGYIVKVYNQSNSANIYTAYLPTQSAQIKQITVKTDNSKVNGSAIEYISFTNANTDVGAFGMHIPGTNYGMDGSKYGVPASASPSDITQQYAFVAGSEYYFKVSAVNQNGFGEYSDAVSLVMSEPPAPVSRVNCTQVLVVNHNDEVMPDKCDINMSWDLPANLYGLKTNYTYKIYQNNNPLGRTLLGSATDKKFKAQQISNLSNASHNISTAEYNRLQNECNQTKRQLEENRSILNEALRANDNCRKELKHCDEQLDLCISNL